MSECKNSLRFPNINEEKKTMWMKPPPGMISPQMTPVKLTPQRKREAMPEITKRTKKDGGDNMEELYNQLAALAKRYGAKRLVLFGSRARGDNRPNSDIDLAVYGMPENNRAEFWMRCEELPTLLKFDIVHIQDGMEPVFLANIERDGVELMDKLHEKYDRFTAAVARLREALDDYKKFPLDSVRDGTIQRFEFCTELAWKTMREYLLDQGYTNINSPKEVVKQAFAFGMIEDSQAWVELLNDRNLTSHVYDEATAKAIFERIEGCYLPLFDRVAAYMKDE